MFDIRVPRLNSNDAGYLLVEWLQDDGALVRSGEPLVVVETSKANEELLAEVDGILHRLVQEGTATVAGGVIGLQFGSAGERSDYLATAVETSSETRNEGLLHNARQAEAAQVVTAPARRLAEELGVPEAALAALDVAVVRTEHVRGLVSGDGPGGDRHQRAIAEVVTESHREIPTAFVAVKVFVDRALDALAEVGDAHGVAVGLPELIIRVMGLVDHEFPAFFATPPDTPPRSAPVGVTIDMGAGLFIPVVPAPGQLSLPELAEKLVDFARKALTRRFRDAELAGAGAIALSLNNEPDVVLARPIVHPGHTCMVSVGGVLDELFLRPDGTPATRRYVHLAATYDHRVANGRDAMAFLGRLKELVENPETSGRNP